MEPIKIRRIEAGPIDLEYLAERKYSLMNRVCAKIVTTEGTIHVSIESGFITDGRSGGWIADLLLPNVGISQEYRRAWLIHDALFAYAAYCIMSKLEPRVSFDSANEIFRKIISMPKREGGAGYSSWRANLAWRFVRSTLGEHAFNEIDSNDRKNFGKVAVTWDIW